MTCHLCVTCGTQYGASIDAPAECRVCVDDRQRVGADGQRWTTHEQLAEALHVRIETDGDLTGIGLVEPFAIPQRALLVHGTDAGNIMWDCTSLVTPDAVTRLTAHRHSEQGQEPFRDAQNGPREEGTVEAMTTSTATRSEKGFHPWTC